MTCLVWVNFYFPSGFGFIFVSSRLGGNIIHCYCLKQNISEGLAMGVRLVSGTSRNRCCSRRLTHLWLPTGSWVGGGRMDTQWGLAPKGLKRNTQPTPPPPNNSNTVSKQIWRVTSKWLLGTENHTMYDIAYCPILRNSPLVFTCQILLNCCWMMIRARNLKSIPIYPKYLCLSFPIFNKLTEAFQWNNK